MYKGKTQRVARHAGGGRKKAVAAAAAILIIALAAYYLVGQGVPQITQTQLIYIPANQTSYFSVSGYTVAMRLQSSASSGVTLYTSRVPVLLGPISAVSLTSGSSASVSSAGSAISDINVKLESSSSSGASIDVTPLPAALSVAPSSSVSVLNPAALGGSNANTSAITRATTVSTTSATTTVQNTAATQEQQALSIANTSSTGLLMKKYKALYDSDTACSASVYATTYSLYYGLVPAVPNDFANVSAFTPTDLTVSVSPVSGSRYNVTYSAVSHSQYTSGPAVILTVDTSSSSVVATKFTGLYTGLGYATINSTYLFQSGVANKACGALISPP